MSEDGRGAAAQHGGTEAFKYEVGEEVYNTNGAVAPLGRVKVLWRRNGYPPPLFSNYWFPLYMVEAVTPSAADVNKGGEVHECCLRRPTP
jgi:hypothetical protein